MFFKSQDSEAQQQLTLKISFRASTLLLECCVAWWGGGFQADSAIHGSPCTLSAEALCKVQIRLNKGLPSHSFEALSSSYTVFLSCPCSHALAPKP